MEKQKEKKESITELFNNIKMVLGAMFKRYPHTRWQVFLYVVLGVLGPSFGFLGPAILFEAVTSESVSKFLIIVFLLVFAERFGEFMFHYLDGEIGNHMLYTRLGDISYRFTEKMLVTDYVNVESQKQQKLIQKAVSALNSNQEGVEQMMRVSIQFVTRSIGLSIYAVVCLILDYRILLVVICMFVSSIYLRNYAISYAHSRREEITETDRKSQYLKRNGLDIRAGKDVRIYRMEHWFQSMYDNLLTQMKKLHIKTESKWYFLVLSDQMWATIRDILAYSVLISMVLAKEINIVTFTLLIGLISGFAYWMWLAAESYANVKQASVQVSDLRKVMNMQDRFHHDEREELPDITKGVRIEFKDVSFRYEDAQTDTLSHLTFVIEPGEKLALVGTNGAGKTTLIKLLCGLYTPTAGSILINGQDVSLMKLDEYYKLFSVVFQDTELMAFNIEMNVSGCVEEEIDRERLKESLQRAGLWERIERLDQGTKTYITQVLDEGGVMFSGGETQKLLLARAIYKNAPILLLDEPSAALDPIAESQMYEEFGRLTQGKTALFISHRLASTRFCNRILLLENGKITEEGSHEELLEKKGRYRELFDIQSHYYKEGVTDNDEAEK